MTDFIVALMKMTMAQRQNASASLAARRYKIRKDWAAWWINDACKCSDV